MKKNTENGYVSNLLGSVLAMLDALSMISGSVGNVLGGLVVTIFRHWSSALLGLVTDWFVLAQLSSAKI